VFVIVLCIVSPFVPPLSYFCTSLLTAATGLKPHCSNYRIYNIISHPAAYEQSRLRLVAELRIIQAYLNPSVSNNGVVLSNAKEGRANIFFVRISPVYYV
jgi:hypothetical protein